MSTIKGFKAEMYSSWCHPLSKFGQCTLLICMTFYALQDLWEAWELQTAWRQTQCKVSIEILFLSSWKNNEEQVYSRQYATHIQTFNSQTSHISPQKFCDLCQRQDVKVWGNLFTAYTLRSWLRGWVVRMMRAGPLAVDTKLAQCQIKVSQSSWRSRLPCAQDRRVVVHEMIWQRIAWHETK